MTPTRTWRGPHSRYAKVGYGLPESCRIEQLCQASGPKYRGRYKWPRSKNRVGVVLRCPIGAPQVGSAIRQRREHGTASLSEEVPRRPLCETARLRFRLGQPYTLRANSDQWRTTLYGCFMTAAARQRHLRVPSRREPAPAPERPILSRRFVGHVARPQLPVRRRSIRRKHGTSRLVKRRHYRSRTEICAVTTFRNHVWLGLP